MKRLLALAVLVAVVNLFAIPSVLAKDPKKKDEKVQQVFDFEEDEVSVGFLKPEIGLIGGTAIEKAPSLIKIREDFVDEIVRSAEDL